ncbi:50S ribosomal protein L15 [Moheibacter stercoris]|uniref:Large ribosomal subunit protein uL15 n=1 Tax=Moheibacter stercoris TaxID=1628251 RepID=A0ABV2LRH6_9FLAO
MKLNNLKPAAGSVKNKFRKGRGEASGNGGTSGRGHKGQKSRSGNKKKVGFEGGQMPLQRRTPKFGFKNINRVEYNGINLDVIQKLVDESKISGTLTKEDLVKQGLAHKNDLIKILGRGELKANVSITADKFTKTAQEAIEKAGGKAELVNAK